RFRDAGGYGAKCSCAGSAQSVECVDYAHYSAEETDERAGCCDGCEPGETARECGNGFTGGGLSGALEWSEIARRTGAAGLALVSFIDVDVDLGERAGLVIGGEGGDFGEARGAAEGGNE